MNAPIAISASARAAAHRAKAREHLAYALHLIARRRNPWVGQYNAEFDDEEIEYRRWQARQEYCRYRIATGRRCWLTSTRRTA